MTTITPLVSVVIPTYNHARFLREALESVQAQTYPYWEAIVLNNYSEDDTVNVVERFGDPRIRLINFRNNGVIAASRNKGIQLAQGEYVAFLDSDDLWKPKKLERCMERMQAGFELVSHGTVWTWKSGKRRNMILQPQGRSLYKSLLYRGNCIATSAVVVKKKLLQRVRGFDENPNYVTAEDYDLWLRIARLSRPASFIKDVLGIYRIHPNNESGAFLKLFHAECVVLDAHFQQEKENNLFTSLQKQKRYAITYYNAARQCRMNGNLPKARTYLAQTLKRNPFLIEGYIESIMMLIAYTISLLKKYS